jgi:hypothetical protein
MSKVKKDNAVDEVIKSQEVSTVQPVVVTALDPIYNDRGQLSYGFTIKLDDTIYSFRTNQQGYLELNGSGIFFNNFILAQ